LGQSRTGNSDALSGNDPEELEKRARAVRKVTLLWGLTGGKKR